MKHPAKSSTKKSAPRGTCNILIANGVNLDLLGRREPEIYGKGTLADLEQVLRQQAPALAAIYHLPPPQLTFYQTNSEQEYLEIISQSWHGALLNPGAWTHTSLALADRLAAVKLPFIEIHISHLAQREPVRQHSYIAPHALGIVSGLGFHSYVAGLLGLLSYMSQSS